MAAAKRDASGVFDKELKNTRTRRALSQDTSAQLSHNGMTFISDTHLPEWTEVGVEMHMPGKDPLQRQTVNCRGVVVECERRGSGMGFEVALLFVDVPKNTQQLLDIPRMRPSSFSISITR